MCKHKNRKKVDHSKPGAYGDEICTDCGMVFHDAFWVAVFIFSLPLTFSVIALLSLLFGDKA